MTLTNLIKVLEQINKLDDFKLTGNLLGNMNFYLNDSYLGYLNFTNLDLNLNYNNENWTLDSNGNLVKGA